MTSLAERRQMIDFKFLYKIVNDYVNYPELLSCFNCNAHHCQTRFVKTLYVPFRKTNYALIGSPFICIINWQGNIAFDCRKRVGKRRVRKNV